MSVFVAGATGVLGRRIVDQLSSDGYDVVGLARDADGANLVESMGGTARVGDVLDPDSLPPAIAEAEVLIHAATAIPVKTKPTAADWARNDEVRLDGARNLIAAAGEDLERFLFPSVVWVARQPDGSPFDEGAARHPDRATRSAAEVEDYLPAAARTNGFDATVLRCGFLYAPDAAHTRQFGRQLLSGDLPIVGSGLLGRGDARLSLLHADDAARAFAAAVDTDPTGSQVPTASQSSTARQGRSDAPIESASFDLYHVVDDQPATVAAFFTAFADRLEAPEPRRIPGWLARLFVGPETVATLTRPMATSNERFRRDVEWEPAYPTYRDGVEQVVETWTEDGTLRDTGTGYEWVGQ